MEFTKKPTRRSLLKAGAALAGCAGLTNLGVVSQTFANHHPQPHEDSLDYLDRETYIHNMEVHAHLETEAGQHGMQMYVKGDRRYMFTARSIIDVTDPLNPVTIKEDPWPVGSLGDIPALAYNKKLGKWIMLVGAGMQPTMPTEDKIGGKYKYPSKIIDVITKPGLRGCRIYDVTDPTDIKLLSEWSADLGDPGRELQGGEGIFHIYYDGGKYAYLNAGLGDDFTRMGSYIRFYNRGLQIIDIEDPANPKFVSNWWLPGQREGEEAEYEKWREHEDRASWTSASCHFYVPKRVEDGGKYCYSTWGSLGFMIHDVSNPEKPRLVSRFQGENTPGSIDFFHSNLSWLDKGIAVVYSEALELDCAAPLIEPYILDVSDPTNPVVLSRLSKPATPPEAPYDDFCDKRGRFGPRFSPHLIAPGKVDRDFFALAYFSGGLQCYDISDPRDPKVVAYFIPPQGGEIDDWNSSYYRQVQNVFIEWDRKLIWVASNTGLYVVSSSQLGKPVLKPMPVREWSIPGITHG
ncbi:MAG: twin-arginine translocation signal domain-containing protein [Betaproteobacteria bacterium]|jgi:hypothetical protein|nr:twin-arginine translocation signal domain-containing protein [Betaproteobacteria bacterium]